MDLSTSLSGLMITLKLAYELFFYILYKCRTKLLLSNSPGGPGMELVLLFFIGKCTLKVIQATHDFKTKQTEVMQTFVYKMNSATAKTFTLL